MGNRNSDIFKKVLEELGPWAKGCTLFLFGSHLLGLNGPRSDIDVLILTHAPMSEGNKVNYKARLKKKGICTIILSMEAFKFDRTHSFLESVPLEVAARYGKKLNSGKQEIFPYMSDEDLVTGMLIGAIYNASHWREYSGPEISSKFLLRSTIRLWHLEGHLDLDDAYSIGHFIHRLLRQSQRPAEQDILWTFVERSGLWGWLDSSLEVDLKTSDFEQWATELSKRLIPFHPRLNSLNLGSISHESFQLQRRHALFQNVEWVRAPSGRKMMKDSGIRFIINLLKK